MTEKETVKHTTIYNIKMW